MSLRVLAVGPVEHGAECHLGVEGAEVLRDGLYESAPFDDGRAELPMAPVLRDLWCALIEPVGEVGEPAHLGALGLELVANLEPVQCLLPCEETAVGIEIVPPALQRPSR